MALVKGYRFTWGGGPIIRPKPPVFDRSWRSPSKNTVKNSTEDTCSWTRPSKIGKRKVKKKRVFQLFDLNFLVCNIFFCGSAGGLARRRIFEFLDPFSDWFSSFCDSRNTGFYSVFPFSACLTASFKTSKNLVNYAVLCYGVNENIVNTSVFWRWLKKHCKLQCFGHLTLKNHGICSGFCFSPRKNTVNNSNFAVFSCFSLFFELRWSATHGYQILRVFFPTISTFGCFWSQWPTSLAVTSGREGLRTTSFKPWRPHRGSCRGATAIEENNGSRREQWLTSLTVWTVHSICTYMIFIYIDISLLCEPNDAVRAVAVAKRREYHGPNIFQFEEPVLETQPGVTVVIWPHGIPQSSTAKGLSAWHLMISPNPHKK